MRPSQLLTAVVALSSVSAAWPDVFDGANALADVKNVLYGRQNDDPSPTETAPPKSTATDEGAKSPNASPTTTSAPKESSVKTTGTPTGKQTTGKTTGTKTGKPKTTEFDPRNGPGGISMITPAVTAGAQYFKIGDWVTLAWNYTSLSVTPSAIDILASCTANQATYTLALNQTVEPTQTFLWDTNAFQASASPPLLTENYKLIIYDAESSVTAPAKAGYLSTFNTFSFGMYEKQPYVPWSEFKCSNCNPNGALSNLEQLTLKALLITSGTTIFSLGYFAFSFGLL